MSGTKRWYPNLIANISAAPWSGSLLALPVKINLPGIILIGILALLLASCSTRQLVETPFNRAQNQQALLDLQSWSLRGRLNIRSNNNSDTININWLQENTDYEIILSGTLGMGAARISGGIGSVLIEKAGEDPLHASSLEEISIESLGYAFPMEYLIYWIRAIPVPDSSADITLNANGLTGSLSQPDSQGRIWNLQYDRYREINDLALPGRIRLEHAQYQLTFLINDWEIPAGDED